jgi:hypothetical protein
MALPSTSGYLGAIHLRPSRGRHASSGSTRLLAAMQDIWVSLHSIRSRSTSFTSFIVGFEDYRRPLHTMRPSRSYWVSSDTGHHRLEASSRSARRQGLPEVSPARLLAAMLGDLGASTLHSIKTMTQFSSLFEHQTSHAACFNARGLLYECVFDALLFSSSYRPVGKPVSHHVVTRPTFFSSFLDHHTGHPARHDTRILLYEFL